MSNIFIKLITIAIILVTFLLSACGSGGSNASPTTGANTDKWITKSSNHALGALEDQILLPMANGDLYLLASKLVTGAGGSRHEPLFAKSTDGGATWSTAGLAAVPATASGVLYGFNAASTGSKIVLTGGVISYPDTNTPPAYNPNVMTYTPTSNTWASYDGSSLAESFVKKTKHAMAHDGAGNLYISGGSFQAPGSTTLETYPSYRLWKSTDAGASWTDVTTGVTETATRGNTAIHNHCMVANGNTLYLLGGASAPIRTDKDGNFITPSEVSDKTVVRRSTDGGVNWTVINTAIPEAPRRAACTQIGSVLYSSGGLNTLDQVTSIVRKSTDGGVTWTVDASSAVHGFRFGHSMTNRNGKVLVLGGFTAGTPANKLDVIEGAP